jgi:flagellin
MVTALRADVGSLQSRFNYAANNLQTSIQNQDASRATYLDADISEESTNFSSAQVLMQASISVLAQANQMPQNLLKLIG